jgi:hypothetical protein
MGRNKAIAGVLLAAVLGAVLCVPGGAETDRRKEVEGRIFFTRNNIWYQHPKKIFNANYHIGTILPLGTSVTMSRVNRGLIRFRVNSTGTDFQIFVHPKFSSRNETVWEYFDKYFSAEDPTKGDFERLADDEQRLIRAGEIQAGMGKWSVLRAYGYPPGCKTPSWESDSWVYWTTGRATRTITFQEGRVTAIK